MASVVQSIVMSANVASGTTYTPAADHYAIVSLINSTGSPVLVNLNGAALTVASNSLTGPFYIGPGATVNAMSLVSIIGVEFKNT